MTLMSSSKSQLPGRMYLNEILIAERTDLETEILLSIERATIEIDYSTIQSRQLDEQILCEAIEYVRSEKFLINNKTMNDKNNMLLGREFDWFAIDINNNFGVFSTAGSGPIPMNVIEDHLNHENISKVINLPNTGSLEIWEDFAKSGLYVYDWELHNGPYLKKANPSSEISDDFKRKLLNLRSLVRIESSFTELNEISKA
jgi:hypothetical protein